MKFSANCSFTHYHWFTMVLSQLPLPLLLLSPPPMPHHHRHCNAAVAAVIVFLYSLSVLENEAVIVSFNWKFCAQSLQHSKQYEPRSSCLHSYIHTHSFIQIFFFCCCFNSRIILNCYMLFIWNYIQIQSTRFDYTLCIYSWNFLWAERHWEMTTKRERARANVLRHISVHDSDGSVCACARIWCVCVCVCDIICTKDRVNEPLIHSLSLPLLLSFSRPYRVLQLSLFPIGKRRAAFGYNIYNFSNFSTAVPLPVHSCSNI